MIGNKSWISWREVDSMGFKFILVPWPILHLAARSLITISIYIPNAKPKQLMPEVWEGTYASRHFDFRPLGFGATFLLEFCPCCWTTKSTAKGRDFSPRTRAFLTSSGGADVDVEMKWWKRCLFPSWNRKLNLFEMCFFFKIHILFNFKGLYTSSLRNGRCGDGCSIQTFVPKKTGALSWSHVDMTTRNKGLYIHPRGHWITYFGGDQTMQMYGSFEGFPLWFIVWVGNTMTPAPPHQHGSLFGASLLRIHFMSIYWQTMIATTKKTATTWQNTTTNMSTTTKDGQLPFIQSIMKVVHDPFGKEFTYLLGFHVPVKHQWYKMHPYQWKMGL